MRDLKSSLTSSWTGGTRGSGPTGPGNSLASAADIVKKSLGNIIDDDDEAPKKQSKKEENIAPSSRYDPTTMNCILDINELTDNDDDSDDGNYDFSSVKAIIRRKRRRRLVVGTVGIIFVATILIGILVNNSKNADSTTTTSSGANLQVSNTLTKEQKLLDLAEQIISACSEEQLTQDRSECERLCNGKMCCFELHTTNEKSKCKEKDCPAYAGCEALLNASTLTEGATNNVDQKVVWWG